MSVSAESQETRITEAPLALRERAIRADGTGRAKLIHPGWGSSGHYSAEMLERDGPRVFHAGLHMYLDHPTFAEDAERPERTVRDLAAVLASDARWMGDGPDGPGLYADITVLEHMRSLIEALAPHTGVSIRAFGMAEHGEAEGREGPIITALMSAESVDFVTLPGAGGKVLQVAESIHRQTSKENDMDPKEFAALTERAMKAETELASLRESVTAKDTEIASLKEASAKHEADLARFREAAVITEARGIAAELVAKADLPDVTRKRVAESASRNPATKDDGSLDVEKFTAAVTEAVKAEAAYLAEVTKSGAVAGMGSDGESTDDNAGALNDQLAETFRRMGMSESGAKLAAAGRNN